MYFMKKIIQILITLLIAFIPLSLFAIDAKIETAYNQLISKLDKKYSTQSQQLILKDLHAKIEEFSQKPNYINLKPVLDDLQVLNNEKLYQIWLDLELSPASQKIQELRDISAFKNSIPKRDIPSYISNLLSSNIRYIPTDDTREFYENNQIKRIIYSSYIPITESNASRLKNDAWIIIYDSSSWYRFIQEYSFEVKIPYSELAENFEVYLTENHKVSERSDWFYGYNFVNFQFYQDTYGIYPSTLETSWFNYDTTLLYKKVDGWYNFVTEYDNYKIAESSDVFGIPEKHLLLDYLREDAKFETTDISSQLRSIRSLSQSLTAWKNRQESIESIYAWILWNIEYSQVIDITDEKIFSGIETFKNKQWVCTWYTKLSSYLFYFAGYHDVEVIRGHVIDAQDFPQIGHAWLKIWDLYYDPTFDDPVWAQNTKQPWDYKYFGLPKDIFYANRYEYGDLPEYLNTATDYEIRQHIFTKLTNLIPKYQNTLSNYPVFWEVLFRNTYNVPVSNPITPEILSQSIWSFTVANNSFRYTDSTGTQRQITWLRYYPLTQQNTSSVLDILWYNTDDITLFNWQTKSGNFEWRLAYELETK